MKPNSTSVARPARRHLLAPHLPWRSLLQRTVLGFACSAAAFTSGCGSPHSRPPIASIKEIEAQSQTLRPGDVVRISFPRAATLDTTQQIRRDGKINLYLVGEVVAAHLSPAELEKKLLDLYANELVSKEVRVTVVSSAFAVFVTGSVMRPGKLTPERTLTAFEAIMEAGGFDNAKADTKAVTVIRTETSGETRNYTLNLKAVLEGKKSEPFYLQAYDIVYVPERFSWF